MDKPLGADDAAPLPFPLTSLVGRERDVSQVISLLQSGETRLLTLTGPGGVGKTRLSLQVAAGSRRRFADGAYFIPLAPISNPDLVLSTIAQTLGVPESPGQTLFRSLCSSLRDRHLLLVLDNFEQVLSAGPQVLDLLQCAPKLHALITSRTVLHVYGEREHPVSPLAIPEGQQNMSVDQMVGYDAVRLFVERARAVKAEFSVTVDNAPAIAEICRRLDGLPLAIELAAARIKLMSPQAILKRLDQTLPLLTRGATSLPYRHQTLRDAIAWSYDFLSEEEKWLFRSMSVFVGGCTLEAAEGVCARGKQEFAKGTVLDGLAALVDKSLLKHEVQDDGEPRFSMLETIREFALEELESMGEAQALRRRYAEYFVLWGEEVKPGLEGPEQIAWLDRLELDRDNLRATLNWLLGQGEAGASDAAEHALRLLMSLSTFWDSAIPSEREKWLVRALAQLPPEATALRSRALRRVSVMARWQGDFPRAKTLAEQAVAVATELGDKAQITAALGNLAVVELMQGNYDASRALLEECLIVYRELGDSHYIAATLTNLGEVARYEGDYRRAEGFYRESLQVSRALGEPTTILAAMVSLGLTIKHLGNYREARTIYLEALALAQEVASPGRASTILTGLSGVILAEMDESSGAATQKRRPFEQVARLAGLTSKLLELSGRLLEPPDQAEYDHSVATTRARLGEEAFTAAWNEGKALSLEDALALALGQPLSTIVPAPTPAKAVATPANELTSREVEVLQLVAAGLTSPGIASQLHLSIGTVQTHLSSIFSKINVHTRAAAVRYAFEHSLV